MNKYSDILNLNRPKSKYPKMSMLDRATQFAPFAALTTHGDAIRETDRLTDKKLILSDEEKKILDNKFQYIIKNINKDIYVEVTYFVPDDKKDGGKYFIIRNNVKKVDLVNKKIKFGYNSSVTINDIIDINIINE